jgi:hypothetical protein
VRVEGGGQGLGQGQEHLGVDRLVVPGLAGRLPEHVPDPQGQRVAAGLDPAQEVRVVEAEAGQQAEGPAACSSRAARLTASPTTSELPISGPLVMTSPVLTPVCNSRRTRHVGHSSWFSSARAACMSLAALTARRASSSWAAGMPNTAMTASPANFSTVPPWWRTTVRMAS